MHARRALLLLSISCTTISACGSSKTTGRSESTRGEGGTTASGGSTSGGSSAGGSAGALSTGGIAGSAGSATNLGGNAGASAGMAATAGMTTSGSGGSGGSGGAGGAGTGASSGVCDAVPYDRCSAEAECVASACAAERDGCTGTPGASCAPYDACKSACACGDSTCIYDCLTQASLECLNCAAALRDCALRNCADSCPNENKTHTCGELATCCIGLSGTYRTGCIQRDSPEAACASYYNTYCVPRSCADLEACCASQAPSDQPRCNEYLAMAGGDAVKCSIAFEYEISCLR